MNFSAQISSTILCGYDGREDDNRGESSLHVLHVDPAMLQSSGLVKVVPEGTNGGLAFVR